MFAALLMDIEKSRDYAIADRTEVQQRIRDSILILNDIFTVELEHNVIFSGGDEIQGLFRTAQSAYLYQRFLRILLFPVLLRSGIGYGDWTVRMHEGGSTEQDGPAYHRARHALHAIEKMPEYKIIYNSESKQDIFVNQMLHGAELLGQHCTAYQKQLILLCEFLYPIDAGQILNSFKISELFNLWNVWQDEKMNNPFDEGKKSSSVDAFAVVSELCITTGQIRGISRELSKILGVSRQSIEKAIKTGYIIELRNETIAILQYVREIAFAHNNGR